MKNEDTLKNGQEVRHFERHTDPKSGANIYQEVEMTSRYVDTHQAVSFSSSSVMLHSFAN